MHDACSLEIEIHVSCEYIHIFVRNKLLLMSAIQKKYKSRVRFNSIQFNSIQSSSSPHAKKKESLASTNNRLNSKICIPNRK